MATVSNELASCMTVEGKSRSTDDITLVFIQVSSLIVLSHLIHLFLKRLGQPSAVSQILAGIIMGPTLVGRITKASDIFEHTDDDLLASVASMGRMFFMFLIGLEMDGPYLLRSFRPASIVVLGGVLACALISCLTLPFTIPLFDVKGSYLLFALSLTLILSNTASPVLIRMVTELKLSMTEVGRISISSSLISDIGCLLIVALLSLLPGGAQDSRSTSNKIVGEVGAMVLLVVSAWGIRKLVQMLNWRYDHRRRISDTVVVLLMMMIFAVSCGMEMMGYPSMIASFAIGIVFPRDGPTARTIIKRMTYGINNLILPVFFGYAGSRTDLVMIRERKVVITVVAVIVMGTVGKVLGTVAAAKYLRLPLKEGLVLGFLLNVKGHVDLIILSIGSKFGLWGPATSTALLITAFLNSLSAGPAVAYVVRRDRRTIKYQSRGLEWLSLENELRLLACVHAPHDVPTALDLLEITRGSDHMTPIAPYLMHLVELTSSVRTTMLYHQLQDKDLDGDMGGDNARQINVAVDTFIDESGVTLRQLTAISTYTTMHDDVCYAAQDVRASLIIIPFHRRQRFDGKMGAGKDGIRQMNINVLRHAQCTVGILIDRGMGGGNVAHEGAVSGDRRMHHVVVLFFGGADDREALAYGGRLAMHPAVDVTVMRFVPSFSRRGEGIYAATGNDSMTDRDEGRKAFMEVDEGDADDVFMANFYNRFVMTGVVTYVERLVENASETVTALASMDGMYSLFIVGRQREGPTTQLMMGMSDWEECPELGSVGDLLASSDFTLSGSVLVIQQYHVSNKDKFKNAEGNDDKDIDDEFKV